MSQVTSLSVGPSSHIGIRSTRARPADLGVAAQRIRSTPPAELLRDLDHRLRGPPPHLHARDVVAACHAMHEEDVDGLARCEASPIQARVEVGVLGEAVRDCLADDMRHGDARPGCSPRVLDERHERGGVDLEVAVDLRIARLAPDRCSDPAPARCPDRVVSHRCRDESLQVRSRSAQSRQARLRR